MRIEFVRARTAPPSDSTRMPAALPTDTRPTRRHGKGWRFLQHPLTRILVATALISAVAVAIQLLAFALGAAPRSPLGSALGLALAASIVAVYVGFVRRVEQRRVVELGFDRATGEIASGFLLGLALCGTTVLVLWLAGVCTVERGGGLAAMLPGLCIAVSAGVAEEILLRGVVFRIVEERLGSWIALALSAAIFGLLHGLKPGASIASVLAIALEAGVLLAAAYMYTRRLWLPIALHAAWNFAQLGIFGVRAADNTEPGLLSTQFSGAEILTGGEYGPDLSVVTIALCLAAAAVLIELARMRRGIVEPPWMTSRAMN